MFRIALVWLIPASLTISVGRAEWFRCADAELRSQVEADWIAQEQRWGRRCEDPQAIAAVVRSGEALFSVLSDSHADLRSERTAFESLLEKANQLESQTQEERAVLYRDLRWAIRSAALKNPRIADRPVVFMKRRRFICQMLHEYLGYYYDYGDIEGGGVFVLEKPGHSLAVRDLTGNRLGRGNFTTLSLSYDARTIFFAFAARADGEKPDFYSTERRCFHIHAINIDGSNLRQVTFGPDDDFDPCPLPDGGIAFMSSARGGFTRCNNPWEPLPAHTLHRLDPTWRRRQTLSFHETSEWHPSVLHDGRIVYIRWDYVDRSAANFHGLWVTNPDGTATRALFGNYTMHINACYQPRAVPDSEKVVFIAGAHHADVGGSLVLLDPRAVGLDARTGEDRFAAIEKLTPEICYPESTGWPESYFHSPWPLSEDMYLVAFSFDPLPGMSAKETRRDTETGVYYFDRFGNMELLYQDKGISCMYPIPLVPRPMPPVVPSMVDEKLGNEGEFLVGNVTASHFAMPSDRRIVQLRIYQVLPKSRTHVANDPRIGHANAESARMLLGAVPVESDGSAYFRAPAGKPLYFQAVDEAGRAVQSMRSVVYLQPGERRGCVGCHEPIGNVKDNQIVTLASRREPSSIEPGPEGTHPYSFPILVQPILDKHCVRCHDGSQGDGKSKLALTGVPTGQFTKSYENLRPFVRWYEWGGDSIEPIISRPGRIGADESPLTRIIIDRTHAEHVKLEETELRRLYLWLDGNVPFYGAYGTDEQYAQQHGMVIPPPALQ
ncbi:MAG: hypothetical protein JW828_08795 [Sedimentisphaerales bacterium]|nr:hypothetical protein [Sedimentisphaerales bacterium]